MKKSVLRKSLLAIAAVSALVATACSSGGTSASGSAPASAPTKISIGIPVQVASFMLPYLANQEGYFQKQGLDVSVTVIPSAELLPAVVSGTIQFVITAAPQMDIAGLKSGVRLIGEWTQHSNESYIVTRAAIKTPADLKGQTITSSAPGSSTNVLTLYMLKKYGLSGTDVHFVALAGSSLVDGAWKSGQIAGTTQSQPGLSEFLSQLPGSHVLYDFTPLSFTGAELIANQSYLTSHRTAVLGLIRGLNEALQTWWSNPALAKSVIVANGGTAATAQLSYNSTLAVFQKSITEISPGQEQSVFQILHSTYDPSITADEASNVLAPGYVTAALSSK